MIFRQAKMVEVHELLKEGYQVWSKNRTLEQYIADNSMEDAYGTRYVIEENGRIVSSLILLELGGLLDRKVYGIGSVVTPAHQKHKGYATELLRQGLQQITEREAIVFLYSDVSPTFYERFQFRVLPNHLQKDKDSICMVRCDETIWKQLSSSSINLLPDHF